MPRQLVNREELGRSIAQTSGAVTMIDHSHYGIKSKSGFSTYTVIATEAGWICSCLDYARYNAKCKHVYAIEYYRSATF